MTLQQSLDNLIETLPKRQRDIIVQRFGISHAKPKTLAFLGSKYSVTRERVRQIESAGLRALYKEAEHNDFLVSLMKKATTHIESLGGIRREDLLVDDLKFVFRDQSVTDSYINLLFSIFKKPVYLSETNDLLPFWYLQPQNLKDLKNFITKIAQLLKNKKEQLIEKKKFDELFVHATRLHKVRDFVGLNFLLNSKKFSVNPFGDFGLVEWPEIAPKTIRDKSYLVLKKLRRPLHFREIAQEINKIRFDVKRAHPQTVHNELIKDRRFVLVGRGLYSLREFGLEPGTTREVLQKLLKKQGPLSLDKIVNLVSEQRVLKYNTIFLNLQNKKFFKKTSDGSYHVA